MTLPDVIEILADLQGGDLASQVRALERFFALPPNSLSEASKRVILNAGVRAMETASAPYPIAERLLRFRGQAVSSLLDLMNRSPSAEVKVLASLILVNNGSRLGVPTLVEEIERGGDFMPMASYALANAGFTDHVPTIIERLRRWSMPPFQQFPTSEEDMMESFLDVLKKLQIPLPDDIRRKFGAPQASPYFRAAVERNYAKHSTS